MYIHNYPYDDTHRIIPRKKKIKNRKPLKEKKKKVSVLKFWNYSLTGDDPLQNIGNLASKM